MAKNKKKSKGNGTGQNQPTPKNTAPSKTAPLASKKKVTSDIKLGTIAAFARALTRVKERAEAKSVDYIGVLKSPDFVPTAVYLHEEESVRVVLARLGVVKQDEVKIAPAVDEKNVNTGAPKKQKAAPEEDEFIKRPRPKYTEDTIEVPGGFSADFVIGRRRPSLTENNPLISSRLGWKYGYPQAYGNMVMSLDGKPLGILSKIRLEETYLKASRMLKSGEKLPLSKEQFDECFDMVKAYIEKKNKKRDAKQPVLVQEFLDIKELDYRELMIPYASQFAKTVKLACEYDMAETKRLAATWKKIKKYRHKVPLGVSADGLGIFSDRDVGILNSRGIKILNKIKAHSVLELKSLLLDKDFATFVKDVNGAFKEDKARRRDARYKTYPFVFTTISLIFAIFIAFTYKYTLIKETLGASIINNTFVVWMLGLLIMTAGIIRAPFRRKKHKSYHYFTRNVRRKTRHLIELSIFAIAISILFFQRYDGYNGSVYYRFVDDGTITIAGLVDDDTEHLEIPGSIDGYTVSAIMPKAFEGDDALCTVVIPSSVETIGKYAFSGCSELESITAKSGVSGVKTIEDKAFQKCYALVGTDILKSVETVGKNVFKDGSIEKMELDSVKTLSKSSFEFLHSLKSVTLSPSLETIPESCFEGCVNLTELSNYGGVKNIEKKAFKECTVLPGVSLDGVEYIGNNAFEYCSAFTAINIADSVVEIGKNAFKNCDNVTAFETPFIGKNREESAKYSFDYYINCDDEKQSFSVTLRGMTSIHSKAFEDCSAIVSVDFGDTVTEIQAGAFKNAMSLQSITLPDVIATVAEEAFAGCANLKTVNGIEHVSVIEKSAFEDCYALSEINLSYVSKIGERAFAGCYWITYIGTPDNLTEIGKEAFKGCNNLQTLDFTSSDLRTLGEGAFLECGSLKSVALPGTITEIPAKAFRSCYNLNTFEFSNSIRTIGKEAFAYSGIENPELNGTLSEIGEGAFKNCNDIRVLTIPSSVKSIGKNAFKDCYSLHTVEAPFFGTEAGGKNGSDKVFGTNHNIQSVIVNGSGTLTKNDMKAFKKYLANVTIKGNINEIGEGAFKGFKNLSTVNFGSSVTTIAKEAFYDCDSIYTMSLVGTSITTIGKSAFAKSGIETFTVGEAVRTIEEAAFSDSDIEVLDLSVAQSLRELPKKVCYDCEYLYDIRFPDSLDSIGEAAFRYCDDIGELSLRHIKTVGKAAFKNCDSLTEIEIVDVTVIEAEAFASTGLVSVVIPNNCNELGKSVFANCKYLKGLTIARGVKSIGKNIVSGCKRLEKLEIPFIGADRDTAKKISYIGYYKSLTDIVITDATKIAKSAFKGCESLEELTLNEGIKDIGDKVVDGCDMLFTVNAPKSLSKFKDKFPAGVLNYPDEEE